MDIPHKLHEVTTSASDTVWWIAGGLMSYPIWGAWLNNIHEGAAFAAPIIGCVLGLAQLAKTVRSWYLEVTRRGNTDDTSDDHE